MRTLPLALLCFASLTLTAADWPSYLGPESNATAAAEDASKIPTIWSETENLAWKTELPGAGTSCPIVVGNNVFVTCYTGTGGNALQRHLVSVDATTGEILWQRTVDAIDAEDPYSGFLTEHGYASNTPTCDGERVYAFFGKSGLHAFSMTGAPLWQAEVGTGSSQKVWGSATSPLLHGDLVIVVASDESRRILAFHKETGALVWEETAELLEQVYASPRIMKRSDGREDLIITATEEVWGMDPTDGTLLWYASHGLTGNISPNPVIVGNTIIVNGGYPSNRRVAFDAPTTGEMSSDRIKWDESNASYIPTPVHHEGHLYLINDTGMAYCMEATTGEIVYKERVEQIAGAGGKNRPVYASPLLLGDRIVCVTRYGGALVLAAKSEFEVLAHNVFASDETQFNATPAVAHGALYLRSDSMLYKVGEQ